MAHLGGRRHAAHDLLGPLAAVRPDDGKHLLDELGALLVEKFLLRRRRGMVDPWRLVVAAAAQPPSWPLPSALR